MSTATPWAVVPKAEEVAPKMEESVEAKSSPEQGQARVEDTPGHSVLDSSDDGEKIHTLARRLTQHSIKSHEIGHVNPFDNTDNPLLDPLSEKFSPRAWMKALMGIQSRDPERYPSRVAGVAYKNLSAHGFGEATDYQKVSISRLIRSFMARELRVMTRLGSR
jgi:ATP-binding cassette, subfamily G (WHITE), member 2, PDR